MTVAELIERLEAMPPTLLVDVKVAESTGYEHYLVADVTEIAPDHDEPPECGRVMLTLGELSDA